MFAHPFDAPCKEAEAMEKQALGRINRIGQQAASLVLWRVVTEDTIEQEIQEQRDREHAAKRARTQ